MLSVPSRDGKNDARDCAGWLLEKQLGLRLWPVHRLDFEVSGLLLFAKDADAHRVANEAFEYGRIQKTYQALTTSHARAPDPRLHEGYDTLNVGAENETVLWSAPIVRGKRRSFVAAHGKESLTRARWTHHEQGRLWFLEPLTGRSHQLRVHLALAGFPIIGDALYGSTESVGDGIALHAWRLDFSAIPDVKRFGLPTSIEAPPRFC